MHLYVKARYHLPTALYLAASCHHMELSFLYTFVLCALVVVCVVCRFLPYLLSPWRTICWMISRWVINTNMINRHRWIRPYAWSDVLPWTIYLALNAFFVWYPDGSMETAARRSGLLALTNVCFTYAYPSISLLGDILGAKLRICRQLHHAAGFMACVESGLHVLLKWTTKGNIQLGERRMVYGVVVSATFLSASFPRVAG